MTTKTNISAAAAAIGRKGGSARTEAKRAASATNGRKGGRPRMIELRELHDRASERVNRSPRLRPFADFILADWPETKEGDHLRWVCYAPVSEIVEWAEAGQ